MVLSAATPADDIWSIDDERAVVYRFSPKYPSVNDHIEMSGRRVSGIISYSLLTDRSLRVVRDIIFPQVRVLYPTAAPDGAEYRNYARAQFSDRDLPNVYCNGAEVMPGPVPIVRIDGALSMAHTPFDGLQITRTFFPAMFEPAFVEEWEMVNVSGQALEVQVEEFRREMAYRGPGGRFRILATAHGVGEGTLEAGERRSFAMIYRLVESTEEPEPLDPAKMAQDRQAFLQAVSDHLILETPEPVLDTLFHLAKIRACESLFDTRMGLVHSPGGGRYYTGIWANDQAEYANPFFPYTGYEPAIQAAINAYDMFMENLPPPGSPISSSFEMQGELPCCGKDRGDAAMILYGLSHFILALGDEAMAAHFWPLLEWSAEYCHDKRNLFGVVESTTDEMEGRLPTGDANLATSCLYFGGLELARHVARALGKSEEANTYRQRMRELEGAIERYFGTTYHGLDTYSYFEGHEGLRHWVSLPLVVGLDQRREDTLTAVMDALWTPHGLRVELDADGTDQTNMFWDRATLYGLRGAFYAGGSDRAMDRLLEYSKVRLLGEHVPYPIEAYPEGNMAHLSAESALYCRVFTEGLLGLKPTGLKSFRIKPNLPEGWNRYTLREIHAFGRVFDIAVEQGASPSSFVISISRAGQTILQHSMDKGDSFNFSW